MNKPHNAHLKSRNKFTNVIYNSIASSSSSRDGVLHRMAAQHERREATYQETWVNPVDHVMGRDKEDNGSLVSADESSVVVAVVDVHRSGEYEDGERCHSTIAKDKTSTSSIGHAIRPTSNAISKSDRSDCKSPNERASARKGDSTVLSAKGKLLKSKNSIGCKHTFCSACWRSYLNIKIQDGDANNIQCPAVGCNILVDVEFIERMVSPEMARKYMQFDLQVSYLLVLSFKKRN